MSFLLRATLVIGVLSYCAAHRDRPVVFSLQGDGSAGTALAAAWEALPSDAKERVAREGTAEIVRRMAGSTPVSRDTLGDDDRRPSWRGADSR